MQKISLALSLLFMVSSIALAQQKKLMSNEESAAKVVHWLSYLSLDYAEAVQNGAIADEDEYEEQQEFIQKSIALTSDSNFVDTEQKQDILFQLYELKQEIDALQSAEKVKELAKSIVENIIDWSSIETAPKVWPSLAEGKALYAVHCASCHGNSGRGDGPAGVSLNPLPSSFLEVEKMNHFSAYQAFNTIRFGLDGTGMRPFHELTKDEIWALSFYVKSMRFNEDSLDRTALRNQFDTVLELFSLDEIAWLTDEALLEKIKESSPNDAKMKLMALRSMEPEITTPSANLEVQKESSKTQYWGWLIGLLILAVILFVWSKKRQK